MSQNKAVTGAIALVKVNGQVVGKLRNVRAQESYRRGNVQGIGTIFDSEVPVLKFDGTLTCDSVLMKFKNGAIPGAIRRDFTNVASQVLTGNTSFEDQLVLDQDGIQVDIFEKVTDVVDPVTGLIKPKLQPIAIVKRCFIESDSLDISEGTVSGENQSFKFLDPITEA